MMGGKSMNRRAFLMMSFWTVTGLGIINPAAVLGADKKGPAKPNSSLQGYRLDKTIFCQFESRTLKREIEQLAKDLGCRVYHGEPGSFDIIGVPYFVSIVDRRVVGRQAWKTYLEYCRETGDKTPCLIIDGQEGLGLKFPSLRNSVLFDPRDKRTAKYIKHLIAAAKTGYSSRYYG
jgi:hypothetical protein